MTLIHQLFVVDAPLEAAWRHLSRVERWPSWARHIGRIELEPPGELNSASVGLVVLKTGMKSRFQVTEFNPHRNWKWIGTFLWLTVHYDHQFKRIDQRHTKLVWMVDAEGFGAGLFGLLFALVYGFSLKRAIPRLMEEMRRISV